MPAISTDRAHWLARHILPLEPNLRAWLARAVPHGLQPDDVVQEAYARLALLPSVSDIQQPKAYLFQVAKRLISEHIRRAHVIPIESVAELAAAQVPHEGRSPERIVSGHQELERLSVAIDHLPARCRTVFVLRKVDEMSQKEIATHLNISERCVEKRMSRALKALVKALQYPTENVDGEPGAKPVTQSLLKIRQRGNRAP